MILFFILRLDKFCSKSYPLSMEDVSWQDGIYPNPQSDLIASGIYEEESLLEDGHTKTIVSVIALFGFAVFLFGGITQIYGLYYGTKSLFDPINWGLIFTNAHLIYILGPLAFIISAGFLYLFSKLRTLTFRNLFFSVVFQVIAGGYMIVYILINQAATKGLDLTGTAENGFHLIDFLDITFQILVILVVIALLIIPCFLLIKRTKITLQMLKCFLSYMWINKIFGTRENILWYLKSSVEIKLQIVLRLYLKKKHLVRRLLCSIKTDTV